MKKQLKDLLIGASDINELWIECNNSKSNFVEGLKPISYLLIVLKKIDSVVSIRKCNKSDYVVVLNDIEIFNRLNCYCNTYDEIYLKELNL